VSSVVPCQASFSFEEASLEVEAKADGCVDVLVGVRSNVKNRHELGKEVERRSPLFAAFTQAEAVKRKAQAKNHSPDSHEPTFTFLVSAERSEAALGT